MVVQPELVTQKEMEDILRWKCMAEGQDNEVSALLGSQSFNRTNKEQPRLQRRHSRTPKLRSQRYAASDSDSDTDLFEYMQKHDNDDVHPEHCKSDITSAKQYHPNIRPHTSIDTGHNRGRSRSRAECSDIAEVEKLPVKPCLKTSKVNERRKSMGCRVSLGRQSSCRRVSSLSRVPARVAHSNIGVTEPKADPLSRLSYVNRPKSCTLFDFPTSQGKEYRHGHVSATEKMLTDCGVMGDNMLHADSFNGTSRFKHPNFCGTNTSAANICGSTSVQRKCVTMVSKASTSRHGEASRTTTFSTPDNASTRRKHSGAHDIPRSSSSSWSKQKHYPTNSGPIQKTRADSTAVAGGNMASQNDRFISYSDIQHQKHFGGKTNRHFIEHGKTNSTLTHREHITNKTDKPVAKEQLHGADVNSCSSRHKVLTHSYTPYQTSSVLTNRTETLDRKER